MHCLQTFTNQERSQRSAHTVNLLPGLLHSTWIHLRNKRTHKLTHPYHQADASRHNGGAGWSSPPSLYHTPPSLYHTPPSLYHTPPSLYHTPPSLYHTPPSLYHTPPSHNHDKSQANHCMATSKALPSPSLYSLERERERVRERESEREETRRVYFTRAIRRVHCQE